MRGMASRNRNQVLWIEALVSLWELDADHKRQIARRQFFLQWAAVLCWSLK